MDNWDGHATNRLAAWIVGQCYGALAWCYDPLVWLLTTGLWYRWVYTAELFVGEDPILEVGFGRGHLLSRLAQNGHDVIGVDKSSAMAHAAQRRLDKNRLSARIICADARSLPLPDASVGTIITVFNGVYVLDQRAWAENARLLKPNGRWIVILGAEGFSFRTLLLTVAVFLEHLGRDKEIARRVAQLFPNEIIHRVQVGSTRLPVMVLDSDRIRVTLATFDTTPVNIMAGGGTSAGQTAG